MREPGGGQTTLALKLAFADRHFSRTVGLRWRPERRSPAADRFVEFCRTADWR